MSPASWTGIQWLNFDAAAIGLVGGATWWTGYLAPEHVAAVHGSALTSVGIMNLLLGKT